MHDLVVVSDLHLGRGRNPETGRFHNLEAFFYDEDFRRFCEWLCREAGEKGTDFKLVLNGDTFDFLRIEPEEPVHERAGERHRAALLPETAASMARHVLEGHPTFARALAHVLQEGHEVVFLPGNHDHELQWEPVQREVRRSLLSRVRPKVGETLEHAVDAAAERLRFEPWFLYEPGRVWIEHGSQYDPECAFRYPLRTAVASLPEADRALERDVPLGNFFQRFLYNAFGHITFLVPSSRANTRYMRYMLLNEPRLLLRVALRQGPFAWRFLRRLARPPGRPLADLQRAHVKELHALAKESGLGETLQHIDGLKQVGADLVQSIRGMARTSLRLTAMALLGAGLLSGLWITGMLAITQMQTAFGVRQGLLMALNFGLLLALMALGVRMLARPPDPYPWHTREGARRVAALLDVPLVTFGHTHDEVVWRVDPPSGRKCWYFNTGTWISVFSHDVLLPRERVQYTFLRVRGTEGELLYWSPGRGEALPVVLLDGGSAQAEPLSPMEIEPA